MPLSAGAGGGGGLAAALRTAQAALDDRDRCPALRVALKLRKRAPLFGLWVRMGGLRTLCTGTRLLRSARPSWVWAYGKMDSSPAALVPTQCRAGRHAGVLHAQAATSSKHARGRARCLRKAPDACSAGAQRHCAPWRAG